MRTRGGAFGTEGELSGYGGKGVGIGGIAAAAVFHTEYQPAVGCFGEGGIGLEHLHRCHGDDVAAASCDGLTAEDGFVQQGRLNLGFVGGFGMKAPMLLFAQQQYDGYYKYQAAYLAYQAAQAGETLSPHLAELAKNY